MNTKHSSRHRPAVLPALGLGALLSCTLPLSALAEVYTVNVGSDAGQDPAITSHCAALGDATHCSLRAAIMLGNTRAGSHVINLAVPMVTIINGDLAQLRAPFTVNGNLATLNGNGHGCFNLTDSGTAALGHADGATGSQLLNLVIGNCSGAGISANGHAYVFSGNRIGTNASGLQAMPNAGHGIEVSASHVYPDTSSNFLLGLYQQFPVQPVDAAQINAFYNNLATALAALQPVLISNNLVSGNAHNGIEIFSRNIGAVMLRDNLIGTDISGNAAIANGGDGVHLVGSSFGNLIGPGNVISGNGANGIRIDAGAVYLPNFIMGNRIGISASLSTVHVGNALSGIVTDTRPDTNPTSFNPSDSALVIGPANVIADNRGANNNAYPDTLGDDHGGIVISGASRRVKVLGNTVGLAEFPAGTALASTSYGNRGDGIIVSASGNAIGSGNVIAANARHGIVVSGSSTTSTAITGNWIGTSPAFPGNFALGNGVDGVHINAASATTIGGAMAGDANQIAANRRNGIKLRNGGGDHNGWANSFQRNLVFANARVMAGVDIDLEHPENASDGPHAEYPANYANRDQAPAQICTGNETAGVCAGSTAPSGGAMTTLQWTIATHGVASFRMEFFAIDAAATTGATRMDLLGEQFVSTTAQGQPANSAACSGGRCTRTLGAVAPGRRVVMTATDITALTDMPGGSGWAGQLMCFAGNNGVILPACTVSDTSEYSNVVTLTGSDLVFGNGFEKL